MLYVKNQLFFAQSFFIGKSRGTIKENNQEDCKMKRLTLIFCLFLTLPANANFFVEPYAGMGKSISDDIQDLDTSFDSFSFSPGLRVGTMKLLGLISAGGDISYQDSTAEEDGGRELSLTRMDYGLFVGANLPILFRGFAKYIFSSSLDIGDNKVIGASGYGLGVGYTGLPFLVLNLEYKNLTWSKVSTDDVERNSDGEISEIFLSLSFPIKL